MCSCGLGKHPSVESCKAYLCRILSGTTSTTIPGGHVWQGPVIQSDEHLLTVLRYIEANPLRAKVVTSAEEYPTDTFLTSGATFVVRSTPLLQASSSRSLSPQN